MSGYSCCYGCVPPERSIGCHSTCEKYLKEVEDGKKMKEEIQREKALSSYNSHTNGTMFTPSKSGKWRKKR